MIIQHSIKKVAVFLIGAAILVLGITLIVNSYQPADSETKPATTANTQTPAAQVATSTPQGSYTLAQLVTHNTAKSCWTNVRGNVYDVTSWIGKHPGGDAAILAMCGKNATAAFEGQHGGQARPESELAAFKIGVLVK